MSNNIDVIIGEDPGVIIDKAFAHLQATLYVKSPVDFIALQLLPKKMKAKVKKNYI